MFRKVQYGQKGKEGDVLGSPIEETLLAVLSGRTTFSAVDASYKVHSARVSGLSLHHSLPLWRLPPWLLPLPILAESRDSVYFECGLVLIWILMRKDGKRGATSSGALKAFLSSGSLRDSRMLRL